ncbi:MAG: ABC-2 family transporter protein [Microlunatus sp.]|nr:ABC-2 family transporter protein [Microlunatus sp.]
MSRTQAQAGIDPIAVPRGPIGHGWMIVRTYIRLGVLNIAQYRGEFFVSLANGVITLVTQLLGLAVIFANTSTLGGWTPAGLLALIGVHTFLSGLIGLVIQPSLQQLMEGIRLGTFDFTLTKPADSQLLAGVAVVAPAQLINLALGAGIVGYACIWMGTVISALQWLYFGLTLIFGVVIVYSFLTLLGTCAFWFVKLDNILVVFSSVFGQAGRWPISLFPGWMRIVLTLLIPVAFAVTVPAQALAAGSSGWLVLAAAAIAAIFFAGSRAFWLYALRHYTGASS